MIWDCFLLNDELDMLECRLTELEDAVDRFVIVEADSTFTSQPKPPQYEVHRQRFARWADRIVYVWATGLPNGSDHWAREYAQRAWFDAGIADAADTDLVMLSDVDEIPHPAIVSELTSGHALEQRYYSFAVDWQMPVNWYGTVTSLAQGARGNWQGLRNERNSLPRTPGGGWHLSWLGGPERTLAKLATSPHLEMVEETRAGIESGKYLQHGGTMSVFGDVPMIPVDVDESWPKYIHERRCPESWFRSR